jgi:bifunctional non-homologous end joining protein LigD
MSQDDPKRFLAHLKIADRRGRILVDWLRNGMGATAVSSFCPRAWPGAGVATPRAWDEVKAGLDPSAFTVRTVPERLKLLKVDPWTGFAETDHQRLPDLAHPRPPRQAVSERDRASNGIRRYKILNCVRGQAETPGLIIWPGTTHTP